MWTIDVLVLTLLFFYLNVFSQVILYNGDIITSRYTVTHLKTGYNSDIKAQGRVTDSNRFNKHQLVLC